MTETTHLFAIEAVQLAAPSVVAGGEVRNLEELASRYQERQRALLAALLGRSGDRVTVDLRVACTPQPLQPAMGVIRLALLVRFDGLSSDDALAGATDIRRALLALHPETDWRLVPAAELPALLQPFTATHVASVSRRAIGVRAPAHPTAPSLGFSTSDSIARAAETLDHLHLSALQPGQPRLDALCRLLLLGRAPAMFSVRMRAEYSLESSLRVLDENLAAGRRLLENTAEAASGSSTVANVMLKHSLAVGVRRRLALQDGGVLARICLVSSERIASSVLSAMEQFLNPPAAPRNSDDPTVHTSMHATSRDAVPADREAMGSLTFNPVEASDDRRLFTHEEAAALMVLPPPVAVEFPGVAVRRWKRVPAPTIVGDIGAPLGMSDDSGTVRLVSVAPADRLRHQYVVGATGTGKSTLLLNAILADLEAGRGFAVFDPHGELVRDVRRFCPAADRERLRFISPWVPNESVAVNPLALPPDCGSHTRHMIADALLDAMRRYQLDDYGKAASEWMGPLFDTHARMNLLLLTSDPDRRATLFDFYELFQTDDAWNKWTPLVWTDPLLASWVGNTLPTTRYTRRTDGGMSLGEYVSAKFQNFVFNPDVRWLFGADRPTLDLDGLLAEGGALLVDLAPARLGARNSRFVGMMLLTMLLGRMFARAGMPEEARAPFHLYIDEFQNIATSALERFLSEGRKFGLGLTLANQYMRQVPEELRSAVLGNIGTTVAFRVGSEDADLLASRFRPTFGADDLMAMPNHVACVSMTTKGSATVAFTVRTLPPPPTRA
jgi:hypothetical protein